LDLHGEAYFTVTSQAKGPQHDFIVKTVDGEVKVIGTRFAVYERGRGTRVVVEKGCVKVLAASDTGRSNRTFSASAFLRPGYLLQFSRGNQSLRPQAVNVKVYTSWRDDEFVFDHTPFRDIVRRIEETYGVHIKVSDKTLLKRSLSGSIENSSLQIITTALAKALQIPVHYEGKNIIFG
ncbi:MAG TPA: DUF4974 domain-containing protein, partial [Bacteroidetes bacterium]|nr:DUF4974 domain-containing protein [Bacteroidota bacterium]